MLHRQAVAGEAAIRHRDLCGDHLAHDGENGPQGPLPRRQADQGGDRLHQHRGVRAVRAVELHHPAKKEIVILRQFLSRLQNGSPMHEEFILKILEKRFNYKFERGSAR